MLAVLQARLVKSAGYVSAPRAVPLGRGYFTMLFVRAATVSVEESSRVVRPTAVSTAARAASFQAPVA